MTETYPDYECLSKTTHIALIHETLRESVARDVSTVAIFVGMWSLGHFAESAALEWAGVLLAATVVFVRALAVFRGNMDRRMTPDEARAWLDRKFPPEVAP